MLFNDQQPETLRNYNCYFGMLTRRQNAFPCLTERGDIFKVWTTTASSLRGSLIK